MGLNRNLEKVSQECIKLNERFKLFGDLHEEIQDLMSGEEQAQDHQVYINFPEEIVPAKRVLQKTWQLKLLWDEKLPEDLLKDWNKWKENLTVLNHVTIPRCCFPGGCLRDATFQLHHFSDASEVGYGTVSYLRIETVDGRVDCSFIMAKSLPPLYSSCLCQDLNYKLPQLP